MKYYARLTHEGITKELMVNNEGKLRVAGMSLKGSLETNATYVDCENNQLTELSCPKATCVYCENNQLTELSCPVADYVYCYKNKLTELNCPNIETLYSDIIKLNGVANMVGVDGIISKVLSTHTLGEYIIHKTVRYYIAVKGKYSAHGKTIKEAIDDCLFKELNESKDKSEIIAEIKAKGTMNWIDYRLLTGSCRKMTLEFLKEKGISEDAEVNIDDVISMTDGRFGNYKVRKVLC